MASLGDIRKKLRSGDLEKKLDNTEQRYKLDVSGTNALLKFGKHHGLTLRQISEKDPSYLDWIRNEAGFPDELKAVVRHIQHSIAAEKIRAAAHSMGEGGLTKDEFLRRVKSAKKGLKR